MTAPATHVGSRKRLTGDEVWQVAAAEYRHMLELMRTLGTATGSVPPTAPHGTSAPWSATSRESPKGLAVASSWCTNIAWGRSS